MRFTYLRLLLIEGDEYGEKRRKEERVEFEEEGTRSTNMNSGLRIISCGHSPVQSLSTPLTRHHHIISSIPRTHTDYSDNTTRRIPLVPTPPVTLRPSRPSLEGAGRGVGVGCVRAKMGMGGAAAQQQ